MDVTKERRERQLAYNRDHSITPAGIRKAINYGIILRERSHDIEKQVVKEDGVEYDVYKAIEDLEREMLEAAEALEYERAAILRDEIRELKREQSSDR